MPLSRARRCAFALLAILVLVVPTSPFGASQSPIPGAHRINVHNYNDTLFANVNDVWDAVMDPATGALWYTTTTGLVAISPDHSTRTLYGRADGFPSDVFYGIAKVNDTLWVSTDRGLVNVDAATMKIRAIFSARLGNFPNNFSLLVNPDADGVLWLGTISNGLIRFDTKTNTTTSFRDQWDPHFNNSPVKAISVGADAIYYSSQVQGFWRVDKKTQNETQILNATGQVFPRPTSVYSEGSLLWLGTEDGLWRYDRAETNASLRWFHYTNANGLASNFVFDIAKRGDRLWVATKNGESVLNETTVDLAANKTGDWRYLDTAQGLADSFVFRLRFTPGFRYGLFVTPSGLSLLDFAAFTLDNFLTLPSHGPNGAGIFQGQLYNGSLWWGSDVGVTSYDPDTSRWTNFGAIDGLVAPVGWKTIYPIYDVRWDKTNGAAWFGTQDGVWGLANINASAWRVFRDYSFSTATNVYFHAEPDGDTVWLPEFGVGLISWNWKTNASARYDFTNSLLNEWFVTDARVIGSTVWVGSYSGLYAFDKGTLKFLPSSFGTADGLPSDAVQGIVHDGLDLWVLTTNGGFARFTTCATCGTGGVASGRVTGVWNRSQVGSHHIANDDVRALVHDGQYLWVGTTGGFGRVDLGSGETLWWNETTLPALASEIITGLAVDGTTLYISTHAGVARFDTSALKLLPMQIRPPPGAVKPPPRDVAPVVTIDSPLEGDAVAGEALVSGSASRPGASIDRVDVSIDGGPWIPAFGGERWSYDWNLSGVPLGDTHSIAARAISGNRTSDIALIHVSVVDVPKTPLAVRTNPPDRAYVGRSLTLTAVVSGDEPLTATVAYRMEGTLAFTRVAMTRDPGASTFSATLPPRALVAGNFTYYIEAASGRLKRTVPSDLADLFNIPVVAPPSASVTLSAPPAVDGKAGASTSFDLTVTNTGTTADTYVLSADGLRASWASVPTDPFHLEPGASVVKTITVDVPTNAFSDNTTLTLSVSPVAGVARPAHLDVPLRILGVAAPTAPPVGSKAAAHGFLGIPAPDAALALAAVALAGLAASSSRRRRS
ncbi:MAG: Ig-like domain-containing protein [Thermoplasmatota archaeon]